MGDCGQNEIKIVRRENSNRALAKSGFRIVHASRDLMQVYNEYLIDEYPDVSSDYVFVNCWEGEIGRPMNYKAINQLLDQLKKKDGNSCFPFISTYSRY